MKRIIFCFDGTWNRLGSKNVTNVVRTAQNIDFVDKNGVAQIIHYDEGVGTKKSEKFRGGLMGKGLTENLAEAYRFLAFNYNPGDEIYIFGFSRGAFSARSFAGLIFNCGIVNDPTQIPEAIKIYKERRSDDTHMNPRFRDFRLKCSPFLCVTQEEFDWRVENKKCKFVPVKMKDNTDLFAALKKPDLGILNIKYIGVWDTVGALGVPKSVMFDKFLNGKHRFHDQKLGPFVASARHAVAIDEHRSTFEPTLWTNVDELNQSIGFNPESDKAPYQQKWFPGDHASVGGGGVFTGLSDEAMQWVWEGAKRLGLKFSTSRSQSLYNIKPDYKESITHSPAPKKFNAMSFFMKKALSKRPRGKVKSEQGHELRPTAFHHIAMSARYRWKENGDNLKPKGPYRPKITLDLVQDALEGWDFNKKAKPISAVHKLAKKTVALETKSGLVTHRVMRGETLGAIAKFYYKDASKYPIIFEANRPMLTSPDLIYPGQVLVIPKF